MFRIIRQQGKGGMVGDRRGQDVVEEEEDEIAELEQRMMSSKLPEHALKAAKKELKVIVRLCCVLCMSTHIFLSLSLSISISSSFLSTSVSLLPSPTPSPPLLQRLKSLPSQFPEHAVSRNYLETILDLPWSVSTSDTLDLTASRKILDADHYGMEKVKKRVVEFLSVRQLKNSLKGWYIKMAA